MQKKVWGLGYTQILRLVGLLAASGPCWTLGKFRQGVPPAGSWPWGHGAAQRSFKRMSVFQDHGSPC